MSDTKTNYLAKLLTLLVKREGGAIKIPIGDLMVDDVGQGFQIHFSQDTRELVLTHVPAGSTIYKVEGQVTWLTNQSLPQTLNPVSKPLSQEDLIAKSWSESAATPTNSEVTRPSKSKVVQLTSEGMAEAELERSKQRVIRELESYQSPQPATRTHSRPLTTFLKQ